MLGLRQSNHLYLFHHVGKCAGTTLVKAMGAMGRRGISLGFPCDTRSKVRRYVRKEIVERRIARSSIRGFFGHRVYYGLHHLCPQTPRYFTFLRHPVGRVISLYNFHCDAALDPEHIIHQRHRDALLQHGELMPFEEWLNEYYVGNQITRFLSYAMADELVHEPGEMVQKHLDHAVQFLELCWFIGFTESSHEDIPFVCEAMGVATPKGRKNVSRKHVQLEKTPQLAALIEARDALDMELYQMARRIRESAKMPRPTFR